MKAGDGRVPGSLEIEELYVSFGGVRAVDGVSLRVEPGEIRGLIGPNGAGKTTLFNAVSRLVAPGSGRILWDGVDLLRQPAHRLAVLGVSRTFQNLELFRSLTVLENVLIGLHSRLSTGVLADGLALPASRRQDETATARALETLRFLGIEGYARTPAASLPYGLQKLVELARAVVSQPRLLLLDEPATGMNAQETQRLAGLIRQVRDDLGATVLLVEHDMTLVLPLCDRVSVMSSGRLIAEGAPAQIQTDPVVVEAYLGTQVEGGGAADAGP